MQVDVDERDADARCVFCHDSLAGETRACGVCSAVVHAACAAELSRCPTLGCAGDWGEAVLTAAPPPARPAPAKGDPAAPLADAPGQAEAPEPRPRRRWRWLAALPALVLVAGWLSSLPRAEGQLAELGGWFSGHGRVLAAIGGTFTGRYTRDLGCEPVNALAFSPDGRRLASLDDDRELIEWDWEAGSALREQRLPFAPVFGWAHWVGYAPDEPVLYAAIGTEIQRLNLEDGSLDAIRTGSAAKISLADPWVLAAWVGTGGRVRVAYTSRDDELTVAGYEPAVAPEPRRLLHAVAEGAYGGAAFSPDGATLVAGRMGQLDVWRIDEGRRELLPTRGYVFAVAFSPDGRYLAWRQNDTLVIRDLHAREAPVLVSTVTERERGRVLRFSPDGRRLASAGERTVVYDRVSGQVLGRYPSHHRDTNDVAWSPDGNRLATCGRDQIVRVWRAPGA